MEAESADWPGGRRWLGRDPAAPLRTSHLVAESAALLLAAVTEGVAAPLSLCGGIYRAVPVSVDAQMPYLIDLCTSSSE